MTERLKNYAKRHGTWGNERFTKMRQKENNDLFISKYKKLSRLNDNVLCLSWYFFSDKLKKYWEFEIKDNRKILVFDGFEISFCDSDSNESINNISIEQQSRIMNFMYPIASINVYGWTPIAVFNLLKAIPEYFPQWNQEVDFLDECYLRNKKRTEIQIVALKNLLKREFKNQSVSGWKFKTGEYYLYLEKYNFHNKKGKIYISQNYINKNTHHLVLEIIQGMDDIFKLSKGRCEIEIIDYASTPIVDEGSFDIDKQTGEVQRITEEAEKLDKKLAVVYGKSDYVEDNEDDAFVFYMNDSSQSFLIYHPRGKKDPIFEHFDIIIKPILLLFIKLRKKCPHIYFRFSEPNY